jgi:hypothetical protein
MVTPNGRKLELVEMGGKLFEVTRIVFDATDGRRGLVSITVPGKPPQQGIYRVGDSFDRGRISVKEIGDGFVVLKCEGEQRTFGVQGAMPDEKNANADVTVTPGTHMLPPRDLGSGDIPPAPTGRVKAPENPVPPREAGSPKPASPSRFFRRTRSRAMTGASSWARCPRTSIAKWCCKPTATPIRCARWASRL